MHLRSGFLNNVRWTQLLSLSLLGLALCLSGCRKDKDFENDLTAEQIYQRGIEALSRSNWGRAIGAYKALQTRYPFGRYTEQSMIDLSYAYYKADEPENALSTLDRFIRTYPAHPNVDYAYYLKGLVNYSRNQGFLEKMMPNRIRDRDQSMAQDAFMDFGELIRRFPDSRYAPDARQRMVFLRNNLSFYELDVARYYMRRKAYVASAARARYALENYPGSPELGDALAILAVSYTELGLPELAEDAEKVLALNYPEHPYLSGDDGKGFWNWLWPWGKDKDPY